MDKIAFPDVELPFEMLEEGKLKRKIRAHGGGLMMVEIFFEAGAIGAEHDHPHEQVCYCLEGKFIFTVDGQEFPLSAGDSLFLPSNSWHGTKCLSKGRLLDIFTPQREDFLNTNR